MIVVSDTTPILSLLKCRQLGLLKILYGSVLIPEAVYRELTTNSAFQNEKTEILNCAFIKTQQVCNQESVQLLQNITGLDAGESEALVLYGEQKADLLLIDEHKGRSVAKKMSVEHVGTMGIFMIAYDRGIITAVEVAHCLEQLLEKDIRLSRNLCNKVLDYVGIDKRFL